ncbi:MAG: [citrate (pro-3S)-lyase] ligase [Clostridia bacterium]|nr:[citrate (pro-3S)-lyase] ligase [Clostridia bacterium]
MHLKTGQPMRGQSLEKLKAFLRLCGLDYDAGVDFTAVLMDDDEIIATGSLDGCTLKCIAVSPMHQGEDLSARIITELRREALERGEEHLLLFTKPGNEAMFTPFGFHPLVRTADCLLMEDRRDGLERFLAGLYRPETDAETGCIVCNCNPFTLGHRYLIETAAKQVEVLHVFVLSEKKSLFPPEVRLKLVREGCQDLKNVFVHKTGPYMVSSATFPSYFIKDKARVDEIYCELDVHLFGERIAPALHIRRRFVGSEPNCPVTRFYNEQLKARLPGYGIELTEIPRRAYGGEAISASRVRALMEAGDIEAIRPLVPEITCETIRRMLNLRHD